MTPRRVGWLVGVAVLVAAAAPLLVWAAIIEMRIGASAGPQRFILLLLFATPLAIVAGLLATRIAAAARGRDFAERFMTVATAGQSEPHDRWGAAMRAELASIGEPRERQQFALSAGASAIGGGPASRWILAASVAAILVSLAVALSPLAPWIDPDIRDSHPEIGLLLALVRALALFAVALAVAFVRRSFRTGLQVGVLALVATVSGTLALTAVEAIVWAEAHGTFTYDDDVPGSAVPLNAVTAVINAIPPIVVFGHLVWLTPWPVFGAVIGARRRGVVAAPPVGDALTGPDPGDRR